MDVAVKALLDACAAEVADVRDGVEGVSSLTTRLILSAQDADQSAALAEAQAFDVLVQRLDGLATVLAALAAGDAPQTAVHAVTLSDMVARLSGRAPAPADADAEAGDFLLFA